jgi:hypothetical protein
MERGMTVRTRTKFVLGLGAVALAAAAVPGAVASGTEAPPITGGGVLRLHMDKAGDYFRFNPPTGTGGATLTQTLTTSKCVASLKASPSLVTLTTPGPPSGAVGLFDHRLGVKTGSEVLTCATVNGTEQLALSLAGQLAAKQIDFGELDVAGVAGTKIQARTALDGDHVATTTVTLSGHGIVSRRWLIDAGVFDTLVLSVDPSTPKGAFWLQGGGHGTPALPGGLGQQLGTKDTVFQLTDFTGTIDCGETAPTVGGGNSPEATFSRGQNDDCEPIPYLLRSDPDNSVLLQKDASDQDGANFLLEVVWPPEEAPDGPLDRTTIDYDGEGGDDPQPVPWCVGTPSDPQLPPERGPEETWCLAEQSIALAGGRNIQVSETYYGAGDPRWAR